MDVDIASAHVRHDEAEALLLVEKLNLAFNHGPAAIARRIASAESIAVKSVPAKTVPAKAMVTAAESIAAEAPAAAPRGRCFRRAGVHAMHSDDLQSTRRVLKVANYCSTNGQLRSTDRR